MKRRAFAMLVLATCGITLCASGIGSAKAQTAGPSVDDMVRALKPPPVRTRSLGRNILIERAQIDLTVEFDFDSVRLRGESIPVLERLSMAMKSEALRGLRFRIEGHTDAVGSPDYNLRLSDRRAKSVGQFLVEQGIDSARLDTVGKGAHELLIESDPFAAPNRRVRVITIE